ncbi:MAG: hypothetical protein CR982_06700 [Candidatus Cloacimonadota bacterium]|nr:MAG: hypothetical protein CR982_06700 [Candidatus Cloacimonadota bacterium]PIE77828.1 MAG: hypothetical protein CSA15_11065 [Candidatus Delongbacteria bacterium]
MNKFSVLVVDDEAQIVNLFTKMFKDFFGVDADTAFNGEEAYKKVVDKSLEGENYTLVVTDFFMPKMDGIELTKKLNKDFPDIKIVMVSGYNYMADSLDSLNLLSYMQKPLDLLDLIDLINEKVLVSK